MWGILVLLGIFLIFFYLFLRLRKSSSDNSQKVLSLDTKPEVGTSDMSRALLNNTNAGTIQAFVYPQQPQKTGQLIMCNASGSNNPGEPECSTGQYKVCRCTAGDCSPCKHGGYVNVLNVSNIFRVELLAAPDAARQTAAGAQLVVRTVGLAFPLTANRVEDTTQAKVQSIFEETIPLPNIPFQKWTYLTIAREGRRFDVYYNEKLVVSKRTQYTVDTSIGFGPVVAGDAELVGKITGLETSSEKLNESQIQENYKRKADTTGAPISTNDTNLMDYMPKCEGGSCLSGPEVRPTSPLLDWETPYA